MPKKKEASTAAVPAVDQKRLASLETPAPVAGIEGPGRWLVAEYQPTSLFSLKISLATSSVAKSLILPTPYSIKMALVDAGFRFGLKDAECEELLKALIGVEIRIALGAHAVVTNTFLKVRQESRDSDPLRPYTSTIAYRELVHHDSRWGWAFDLAAADDSTATRIADLTPFVSYIGKRGSFVQFHRAYRKTSLGPEFTLALPNATNWSPPPRAHIVPLDDFGPQADLAVLSSYSKKPARRNVHRKFIQTIVPVGVVNTGPGFTEYSRD